MNDEKIKKLEKALKEAIDAADGWYDDLHGGKAPNLNMCRELIGQELTEE